MNIFKDRAIWIVLVLIVMAGSAYMVLVDPDRIDKMENIVERDDIRIADVNEVKELFDRLDLKLNGTKQHLSNLWDKTVIHIKAYDVKVDSINNAFLQVDLRLDKIIKDMKKSFDEVRDNLEDLEDDISSVKTQTKRDLRKINVKLAEIEESIRSINLKLEEEEE